MGNDIHEGEKLREYLSTNGGKINTLADLAGVDRTTIYKWYAKEKLSKKILLRLAKGGILPSHFLGRAPEVITETINPGQDILQITQSFLAQLEAKDQLIKQLVEKIESMQRPNSGRLKKAN